MVLGSRPRCRAIAEIFHPWALSAPASTSSSRANIPGGSLPAGRLGHRQHRREPLSDVGTRAREVGNFSERIWGISDERGQCGASTEKTVAGPSIQAFLRNEFGVTD